MSKEIRPMKRIKGELYKKEGSVVAANSVANLVNLANMNSYNRLLLCSSAQKQFVALENPEPPRVDSIYSPGLTYDSTCNIAYDKNLKVLRRFDKYIMGRKTAFSILLLKDKDNNLYTHIHQDYIPLADGFGYRNDGIGAVIKEGEKLEADTYIQKADIFAHDGFCWGKNYYTMYNISGHTVEDAVKISKRVQDETKMCKVSKINILLKSRDRLKNIYGDLKNYKPFPLIGDKVNEDNIMLCISPIESNAQLVASPAILNTIGHNDKPKFVEAGSICVDINVYAPNEEIISDKLIRAIYRECKDFYTTFIAAVEELILINDLKPDFYTEYYLDLYKSKYILGAGLKGANDTIYSKDTHSLEVLYQHYQKIDIGQKCSGMHGNKGVVSEIDDADNLVQVNEIYDRGLFVTESGKEIDIVLNTAGVPNRSNMGAPGEKYINNVMDGILSYHRDPIRKDYKMLEKDIMYVLKYIAPEQHDGIKRCIKEGKYTMRDMLNSILQDDFVIYTNPFPEPCHHEMYELNNAERAEKVYKEFVLNRPEYKGFIGKERIYIKDKDKLIPTNIYAEVSRMYFIFLKYTADKKYGARTLGSFGSNGAPSKTTNKKDNEVLYMETPIKLGVRDTVLITSAFRGEDNQTLMKFLLSTDSEIVDTFSALLGQIGVEIVYSENTIKDIRKLLEEELNRRNEIDI